LNVLTPADRERHLQLTRELLGAVQEIREADASFEFVFPNGTEPISKLAGFIANERLCCPFLEFTLRIGPGEEPVSLILTGPEGTKAFLREEFSEVFA
jgi:hypothetical protein